MNRQLAHLSYDRNKCWDHRDWIPQLEREFREAWQLFMTDVEPQHKSEFENQIDICRSQVGYLIRL
jgi:hypothetical protein